MNALPLLLASTSPYRRELLERLRLPFGAVSPRVDETPRPGEPPGDLALRLAREKALDGARQRPGSLVIGSDQVALLEGRELLGKPGGHERAVLQLLAASGRSVLFLNGLCLYNDRTRSMQTDLVPFRVHFRTLSRERLERYLGMETPYDCAGAFKSEGLGIGLFQRLEGEDPTSLIGLPLIRLVAMLEQEGVFPF